MNYPTLTEVESADIELLRAWLNELPGCDEPGQRSVIVRITERIVATWPKRTRPMIPIEVQALAEMPRPKAARSVTAQPALAISAGPKTTPPEPEPQGSLFFLQALKS